MAALDEERCIDLTGIDKRLIGGDLRVGSGLMNRLGHGPIRDGRVGRVDRRHDMKRVDRTGFGQMPLVAGPRHAPLIADVGLRIVGRVHSRTGRWQSLGLPSAHLPLGIGIVWGYPGLSTHVHGGEFASPAGRRVMIQGVKEGSAIRSTRLPIGGTLGVAFG